MQGYHFLGSKGCPVCAGDRGQRPPFSQVTGDSYASEAPEALTSREELGAACPCSLSPRSPKPQAFQLTPTSSHLEGDLRATSAALGDSSRCPSGKSDGRRKEESWPRGGGGADAEDSRAFSGLFPYPLWPACGAKLPSLILPCISSSPVLF